MLALSLTLAAPAQDADEDATDDSSLQEETTDEQAEDDSSTNEEEEEDDDDSAATDDSTEEPGESDDDKSTDEPTADDKAPADTPATAESTDNNAAEEEPTPDKPKKPNNPRRAASFSAALEAAGEDGVAVYCYGPNWNRRSYDMLSEFWKTPELEAATGGAILVAVPYYEEPTDEQREKNLTAAAGMSGPPHGVCPTVMLFDKDGVKYANLVGIDHLGTDADSYALGYKNLREKLAALHKRNEILKKAQDTPPGVEKAKLLDQLNSLPILPPPGLVEMIREADPNDASGMVRRNTFDALAFLYEQMHTKDGFLAPDFEEDFQSIENACLKVAKDETLKPLDRQAAYLLLIGSSRRHEISGVRLKQLINACAKIDPNSKYGRLATFLNEKWATIRHNTSSADRSNKRAQERKKEKERRNKERDEKRAAKTTEVR